MSINIKENQKRLNELANLISKIEPNNKNGTIIKSIDKLVQEYYVKFYDSIDVKKSFSQEKHGHCC